MQHPLIRSNSLRVALAILSAFPFAAAAQGTAAPTPARLDSIASALVREKQSVGSVTAVVKGDDTLLLKGYGLADVEWNVPMPADAMFEIGSIAKQFTAAAILQLRDAGKLSLDDDLTKWLPDFDTRGNKLPLRRMLDHTSGIVGISEMPEFTNLATNPNFPRDSAYALIKRYPFQFRTGDAQVYNNSAFILLGLVIEKASGMTYEDYIEKRIFAPLGMTRSMYCNSAENVAQRAHGYTIQEGTVYRASQNVHTWPFAAGSICSTAGDLVTWLKALHGGKVLSPKSYAEMIEPAKLNDGTVTRYGMGLNVGRNYGGQRVIGHGGAIDGFKSEADWYPDARMAVVVLANTGGRLDPSGVATEIAARVLPWTPPVFKTFSGDGAALVGTYEGPSRGRVMKVVVAQGPQGMTFSVNGSPARPLPYLDGLTWQGGTALLTFVRASGTGRATQLHFDAGNQGHFVLQRNQRTSSVTSR